LAWISTQDAMNATLLHSFANAGSKAQIVALLEWHADILQCDVYQNTALHHAVTSNNMTAIFLLLEHPNMTDPLYSPLRQQSMQGMVPLTIAIENQFMPAIELLLPHLNLSQDYDYYASNKLSLNDWLVSQEVALDIWQLLIHHGLPINSKNSEAYTALDTALALDKGSIADFLTQQGGFRNAEISKWAINLQFHLQVMHSMCQHQTLMGIAQDYLLVAVSPDILFRVTQSLVFSIGAVVPNGVITHALEEIARQLPSEERIQGALSITLKMLAEPLKTLTTSSIARHYGSTPDQLNEEQALQAKFFKKSIAVLLEMAEEYTSSFGCAQFIPTISDRPGHFLTDAEAKNWL
jgi:hypothetical protein